MWLPGVRRRRHHRHPAVVRIVAMCAAAAIASNTPNAVGAFAAPRAGSAASTANVPRRGRRSSVDTSILSPPPPHPLETLGKGLAAIDVRGGEPSGSDGNGGSGGGWRERKRWIAVAATAAAAAWKRDALLAAYRAARNADLRSSLLSGLDAVNDLGTPGLAAYAVLFALWEIFVGITTPVETAAGMAFGVKRGIVASAVGKIGGAVTAYFIGHLFLQDFVREKLKDNEMMDLVEDSIQQNPIGVALIWRFSFLPEFVKNFGLSVLPLKPIHFVTAVVLHGFPFTCLWTFLGAETGALARGVVLEPSRTLKMLVSGVYIFGFFVSPTLVGLW
eukprot:CAMPEP_0183307644 /NCGR_PEP_ID=MMETSP0160_2-20130417/18489_1 /TAXON_ID=2839 ORGANISM="Odontella Sinensis, Strain Grunow 1884" /NCGR_SAMPLE_ID=MMETSP0160_2 /ASSEMBLY_ACC=CAM_ASM_000250 /LENGTH=331 /DNA_ID=CAMNT_0025471271 /DNA_START=69 /DNA_END=1061 /DNA_ORIENTATION=-